jgi:tetratricopeptide (TPR) repeat protein
MNAVRVRKVVILVALLLICSDTSRSQAPSELPNQLGKINESVVVQSHPDESYALFLPNSYKREQAWPTIFCLDPRGRGKSAIARFVPAAEKYGYIVICSNNSRNGLDWNTISQIFTDLWDDTHSRLSIDEKRTYGAGFSGGSRLAATFASRCRGCLAGVIGCGAGFPGDIAPDAKTTFAYFGLVGVDDFNFGEMWQLEKKFSQLPAPYQFQTFSGGHEWPPPEKIEQAIAWLTLLAMKNGLTVKDNNAIEDQFASRMTAADQLLALQQYVDAQRSLSSMVRDFNDLREVKTVVAKLNQLNDSEELKKEIKTEEELYRRQLREAGEIRTSWMQAPDPEQNTPSRAVVSSRLVDWKKKRELPVDSKDRRLARRILTQLLIEAFETSQASLRKNDYATALTNLQLAKEVDPRNANAAYEIARIYALKRQKKSALQSLEEAVSLGFKDVSRLKAEEAFSEIINDPRYQKLLASISNQ